MESEEYSWAWVTGDRLLSHGACELVYAFMASDGQTTGKAIFYDGENTTGGMIVTMESPANNGKAFSPKQPVYCRKGLYIDFSAGVGVFIQWRERGSPK